MQPVLKGVPESKPAPRPDGLLVDNGEFYFSEFPPGQAVASTCPGRCADRFQQQPLNRRRRQHGASAVHAARRCPARVSPARDRPPPDSPRSPSRQAQPQGLPAQAPVAQPLPVPTPGAVPGRAQGQSPGQAPAGGDPAFPPIPVPRV